MPDSLPAVPPGAEVAGVVYDGEVVEDRAAAALPGVVAVRPAVPPAAVAVLRHGGYVLAGPVVLAKRWHHRRTRHHRVMDALELTGDHEGMLKWAQHHAQAQHQRREDFASSVGAFKTLAIVLGVIALTSPVGMFVLGVLLGIAWRDPWRGIRWPWVTLAHAVAFGVQLAIAIGIAAAFVIPVALVAVLWYAGRTGGSFTPGWLVADKPEEQDAGMVITADTIVLALQNMPVPALKRAVGDGWRPVFTLQPVRDGRGYEAEFSVPLGVTAEMIANGRTVLARNLHRDEIETWPSAGAPGYVRLWVADRGAIGKAAPEYPLLNEGEADVFEGVPGGVIARGDGVLIPVVAANGVLGGLMGQGKSNAGRVIMLGCATDPLCGAGVFVFANNGDFDAYEPRLAVYRKGLDDDVITAAVDWLHEAYRDVGDREQMLADLHAKKVTRQLALQYPQLRPNVTLFSECHELFGHPEYGELAGELAVKIVKRQRKTGRVAWFDTQSSRKAAIPGALVELVSVNCCFAVKSWRSNDGFLGDGSFAAGIRATELRPGRDRGTSLVTGISDAQFELLKWYYVEVNDDTGYDAAAEVIARCMGRVAPGTPVAANSPVPAIELRSLLDDLAEVTRNDGEPVRLADLPPRLRDLAKTYGPYRSLTGTRLREWLDDEDVRTTNSGNVPRLDPADLRAALARREE